MAVIVFSKPSNRKVAITVDGVLVRSFDISQDISIKPASTDIIQILSGGEVYFDFDWRHVAGYVSREALILDLMTNFFFELSTETRLSTLENLTFKISYYEEITAASGTIGKPAESTILLNQWANGVDALVSKIVGGKPDFEDSGVDVSTFDISGNYTTSAALPSSPSALIYYISIPLKYFGNLNPDRVVEYVELSADLSMYAKLADDNVFTGANTFEDVTTFEGKTTDGTTNIVTLNDSAGAKVYEVRTNGHYRSSGNAWKDMIMDLFGKRLSSAAGKVSYDYDDNTVIFKANGNITNADDRVGGNQEINHEFLVGANITYKPHLHWFQQVTGGVVVAHVFTARWRLQRNGQAKETAWNLITANAGTVKDVFDFSARPNGLYNQLTRFDDITVTCSISDTIQLQLTRSDANVGDIPVYFFDIHGRVDSDGSDMEVMKT